MHVDEYSLDVRETKRGVEEFTADIPNVSEEATKDLDDNKFVDCAVVANAEYIVTEDSHFNILKITPFPPVEVKRLHEFYEELCTFDEP